MAVNNGLVVVDDLIHQIAEEDARAILIAYPNPKEVSPIMIDFLQKGSTLMYPMQQRCSLNGA